MVELLTPGVKTIERGGQPTVTGVSTSTTGFLGTARKGATDELTFIASFNDFVRNFGTNFTDSFLEDSLFLYFLNGGARAYIGRVVGAGAAASTVNAPAIGGAATAAVIDSGNAEPFDLEPADDLDISVDGGGAQTFTFNATRATAAGSGLSIVDLTGDTILLGIDGGTTQTITFTGAEASAADVAATINGQLVGGFAVVNTGEVDISSDSRGTDSEVDITGGSALAEIGHTTGTSNGTGNVGNIDAVTTAEVLTIGTGLTGASFSDNNGKVRITHDTAGLTSTLEVTSSPAAFNFPAGEVTGADDASIDLFQVDAVNEGAWGDDISLTTTRWTTTTTAALDNTDTSVMLADVSKVELGDVVVISDGAEEAVVHVVGVTVSTKTISFVAVSGLGSPVSSGATASSASAHRTKTTLASPAADTDTIVAVTSVGQIRLGSELSIDDGTNLIFRTVTFVNGNDVTLDSATGFAYAAGTQVVTQHFNLQVSFEGTLQETHQFLSMSDTDTKDWIEVRLFGDGNQSALVEVTDLNPSIGTAIDDRPRPTAGLQLSAGNNGSAPTDNDFLGTVSPASGLELFNGLNRGEVNILAIPGITTLAVQQGLSDFVQQESRQDMIALVDPPLSMDEPTEVRDWRLNQHNRDSSYSALYYPWLVVRDRNSPNTGATKQFPPSGPMAGMYARVDAETGVWQPPANIPLLGVLDLVRKVSDGEQAILNPIGVNVIRTFPGEGIRPYGARTLAAVTDGRHYVHTRRLLNFVKLSLEQTLRTFVFAPIQTSLFSKIFDVVTDFFRAIWNDGALFPGDDFLSAQFVKVDEENNPPETRALGQLNIDAGIQPPAPAEFIILSLGLFNGEVSVDEL